MVPRGSSNHVTEDCDAESSDESSELGAENVALKGSDTLLPKLDNLRALLRKKKKVEEEIAKARAELQQALQP